MSNLCNSSAIIIFLVIFNKILSIIQIAAPILAIIALARLLLKLVLNPEDKKAKKQIFNSLLALVLVFLVPFLVKLSVNIISESYLTAYCFEEEELSAIMESVFDEPKYIEIDSGKELKPVLPDPDDYEKGVPDQTGPLPGGIVGPSNGNVIYFLNTGLSSDSIIIQDGDKFGLIDTSVSMRGSFIVKQLKALGVKQLDFILLTHMHGDHIGGYSEIMNNFPVRELIIKADGRNDSINGDVYASVINRAKKKGTYICDAKNSECQNFALGNIAFRLYNTDYIKLNASTHQRDKFENANSLCAVATINGRRVYFSGDIGNYYGYDRESIIDAQVGDIDVYKVAHHGYVSFNNNLDAVSKLQAEYAVVTNDRVSSSVAISRVKRSNSNYIKTYYTPEGTVMLMIDVNGNMTFQQ